MGHYLSLMITRNDNLDQK